MPWRTEDLTPIKLGTVPCLVLIHAGDRANLRLGAVIRVQETQGGKWQRVSIDRINADGHIFASR